MREIRTSGSEGGGAGNSTGSPYPYVRPRAHSFREVQVLSRQTLSGLKTKGNCVAVRRGGEQPEVRDRSAG